MTVSDRGPHWGLGLLFRVMEGSSDAVEISDNTGTIVTVNSAWCELFRRSRDMASGGRLQDMLAGGPGMPALQQTWDRCLAQGYASGTAVVLRHDRHPIHLSFHRLLYRNVDGAPVAVLTLYRDVAPSAAISRASPWLKAALEAAPDPMAVFMPNGSLLEANSSFARLTGYSADQLVRLSLTDLAPRATELLSQAASAQAPWTTQLEITRLGGGPATVPVEVVPSRDALENPMGWVLRVQQSGLAQSTAGRSVQGESRRLREFLHEMSNIFAAIVANVTLLERTISDPVARRRLELVQSAVQNGIDLMERVRQDR